MLLSVARCKYKSVGKTRNKTTVNSTRRRVAGEQKQVGPDVRNGRRGGGAASPADGNTQIIIDDPEGRWQFAISASLVVFIRVDDTAWWRALTDCPGAYELSFNGNPSPSPAFPNATLRAHPVK